jgi:hypothetical protein
VDALKVLRFVSGVEVSQPAGCPNPGDQANPLWGDVDCSGAVDAVDALKILRFVAGLPVSQFEPCVDLGQS